MQNKTAFELPERWNSWRFAYIALSLLLAYLLWKLVPLIAKEVRIAYWQRKIPAPPVKTFMSKIVGAPFFDFYPSVAHFVSIEKCTFVYSLLPNHIIHYFNDFFTVFTQLLNGMNVIDSSSNEGLTRVRFGVKRYINLYRWETVEALITSTENISKSDQYDYFLPWLGTGLLTR